MKKINAKKKGARGERLWRDVLRSKGLTARRGQQYCGANGDSDVICEELDLIHFEVKFVKNFNARKALEQAESDVKGGKVPVVVQKSVKKDWIAVIDANELLGLILAAKELREHIKSSDIKYEERPQKNTTRLSDLQQYMNPEKELISTNLYLSGN